VTGLATTFGSGAMTNSINEIENAQVILVSGSNTVKTHPQVARRIFDAVDKGAGLIVIDPRRSLLAKRAHVHLNIRSGTDIPLLNGMMRIILDENLADDAFVEMRTENFHALRDMLYRIDMDEIVAVTGVSLDKISRAAKLYARAHNSVICYCLGMTQHICGTDNVQAIANLAMLTGNVEKENTGVDPLRGQNNVQGACDMGALPAVFPGYQAVSDPEVRRRFERAWQVTLPETPGLTVTEMTHSGPDNPVKAMFIMGENPMISDPALGLVRQKVADLEFLAVSDIFLSETAAVADVVFPAASFAEKNGTFTNTERRVQLVRQAIAPIGECRSDMDIIIALSEKLGYPMPYNSAAEVMEEIALLTPIYGGIYYDRLEPWGLQWPCFDRRHGGTQFLHKYNFARGRGRFVPTVHKPPSEQTDKEYPFVLITGRSYHQYHTGTMSRKTPAFNRECPENLLEMHPADAKSYGIRSGEMVRLISRRGGIQVKVIVTKTVNPGSLFTTFHFAEAPVNELTIPAKDPQAKCPELKVCSARIEKIAA
jgi:predicted molibdopterin-dependent oxidoreductase YjgC